jgi:hypothetical protein
MKPFKKYFFYIVFVFLLFFVGRNGVLAQENIPEDARAEVGLFDEINECKEDGECNLCNLLTIFTNISRKILSIAGGIALVFFVLAGVSFIMSFGNSEKVQSSKKMVIGTIIGLVIILLSWTMVNEFFLFMFGKEKVTQSGEAQVWGTTPWSLLTNFCPIPPRPIKEINTMVDNVMLTIPPPAGNDDKSIRNWLKAQNIETKNAECKGEATKGCTTLTQLPEKALSRLVNLKNDCKVNTMTITGGTEGGHKKHGLGKAAVDLRNTDTKLNDCIESRSKLVRGSALGNWYKDNVTGAFYLSEGDHWHIEF